MANTDAHAQSRDAAFDETPMGGGVCPLLLDIDIFPVRYAIDEAPAEAGAPAPHPIAEEWQGPGYPEIDTRDYTLRQLRDGWLYVWVSEEGETRIDEYLIEGATFNGDPHLTYSTGISIAMAYSSVKWTERINEYVLENADVRQRIMRSVNLSAAVNTTTSASFSAHAAPITQLAEHVADITPDGAVDGFTSTTVSIVERETPPDGFEMNREHRNSDSPIDESREGENESNEKSVYRHFEVKHEITQSKVLFGIANHDEAIFLALDDDLGIVNDLHMALVGRQLELEAFLDEHGHRLQIASVIQSFCGYLDFNDIPQEVRNDVNKLRRARQLVQDLIQVLSGDSYSIESPEQRVINIYDELEELGIEPPDHSAWEATSILRDDVRYEEAIDYIYRYQPQLERLQAHIEDSIKDLTVWLERLPHSAEELCFDTCNANQSRAIHEFGGLVLEALGSAKTGRDWIDDTYQAEDTLISFALFNFDPALAAAIETIAKNYIEVGTEDGEAADSVITPTSVVSQINAANGVLNLEIVQNLSVYQALAPQVKKGFETLRTEVSGSAKRLWETIGHQFLPALSAKGHITVRKTVKALMHPVTVILVHPDLVTTELSQDAALEAKYRDWREESWRLTGEYRTYERRQDNARVGDPRKETYSAEQERIQEQRHQHGVNDPRYVGGRDTSLDERNLGNRRIANNLASVGNYELREMYRIKINEGVAAARRHMTNRMAQYGGGMSLLIAGLNIYNFIGEMGKTERQGSDEEGKQKLITAMSSASVAVMSLWVLPYWNQYANQKFMFDGAMTAVMKVGGSQWLSVENNTQAERLAKKLSTRMAGFFAIGAIGAGVGSLKSFNDFDKATSSEEKMARTIEYYSSLTLFGAAGAQTVGAFAGRWIAFGWVSGPLVSITLFVAGIAQLIASFFVNYYSREGVRAWLYNSTWGNSVEVKWSNNDEGHKEEWRELMEALLKPSVRLKSIVAPEPYISTNESAFQPSAFVDRYQGCWLQISFPAYLSGETIQLSNNARGGKWVPAEDFKKNLPQWGKHNANYKEPENVEYAPDDQRVWQIWLSVTEQSEDTSFLLTVDYSASLISPVEGRSTYVFYKPDASVGKYEIEPEEGTEFCNFTLRQFALSIPLSS
ncbi:T6SS effector BTH_I2691 family protein [Halomonas sp.]|uniref:T6SS effector BTH_I2691 family protein n=1 Tax=Halomonas sp. TaxID=1486246 RepID=UPI003A8E7E2B